MTEAPISIARVGLDDVEPALEAVLTEYHVGVAEAFRRRLADLGEGDREPFSTDAYVRGELETDLGYLADPGVDRPVVVAVSNDEVVGCVYLYHLGPGRAEVKRLYVRPAFRGRGIGRRLMERLIEVAIRAGYSSLRLDTAPFMTGARRLYAELGFEETDGHAPISNVPPALLDEIEFMALSLDARVG